MALDNSKSEDNLGLIIHNQLDIFSEIYQLPANTSSLLKKVLYLLTDESLNQTLNHAYTGLSRINASGFPFQWSLSSGNQPQSVRFLCEAGHPGTPVIDRTNLSFQKVSLLTDLLSFGYPKWLFDSVIPRILPTKIPDYWLSAVWFAVGANSKGILPKIYFNLDRGTILDRWKSVGWVLKDINRELSLQSFCEISANASQGSLPVGVAFDLMPDGEPGRVKIYFKSMKADLKFLDIWYHSCGAENYYPTIRNFLDCFPCDDKYPKDSFVVGLEFPPEDTKNWCPTIKLDLGITEWIQGDHQINEGILRASGVLNIPTKNYLRFLDKLGPGELSKEKCIFHRFAGIGYETDRSVHINVYFEPFIDNLAMKSSNQDLLPPETKVLPSRENIIKAMSNGLLFLSNSQKPNGSWKDFHLPVGESDIWVTAYVLYQLSSLQKNIPQHSLLNECRTHALEWLQITQKNTGGWSYNSAVEEDSDSTSLAVLAFSTMNKPVLEKSLKRLQLYFAKDGGISTYLKGAEESEAWATSQCDVTPLALLALKERLSSSIRQKALNFLLKRQRADGLWPSYWWISPLYATYVALIWFSSNPYNIPRKKMLIQTLNDFNPSGSFETALHLVCINLLNAEKSKTCKKDVSYILNAQLPDGSWPSSPILRLTHPHVERPWMKIDAGPIYRDIGNIITTATVIGTVSRIMNEWD